MTRTNNGRCNLVVDPGSGTIKAMPVSIDENDRVIVRGDPVLCPSRGVSKGFVFDPGEFTTILSGLLARVRNGTRGRLGLVVGVEGPDWVANRHSESMDFLGGTRLVKGIVVKLNDKIEKGLSAGNRIPLHFLTDQHVVDGVHHPREFKYGMNIVSLGVSGTAVTGPVRVQANLQKIVRDSGGRLLRAAYLPLAAGLAVLDPMDRDLGSICLDIGKATTGISVFHEGRPIFADSVSLGGENITRELTAALKVERTVVERIKCEALSASREDLEDERLLLCGEPDQNAARPFLLKEINQVVRYFLEYYFRFIRDQVLSPQVLSRLCGSVAITGGSARLPGICEVAGEVFGMHAAIGRPRMLDGMSEEFAAPEFAAMTGIPLLVSQGSVYSPWEEGTAWTRDRVIGFLLD